VPRRVHETLQRDGARERDTYNPYLTMVFVKFIPTTGITTLSYVANPDGQSFFLDARAIQPQYLSTTLLSNRARREKSLRGGNPDAALFGNQGSSSIVSNYL